MLTLSLWQHAATPSLHTVYNPQFTDVRTQGMMTCRVDACVSSRRDSRKLYQLSEYTHAPVAKSLLPLHEWLTKPVQAVAGARKLLLDTAPGNLEGLKKMPVASQLQMGMYQ